MEKEALNILNVYWTDFLLLLPRLIVGFLILAVFIFIASRLFHLLNKRLQNRLNDILLASFISRIVKWGVLLIGFVVFMQIVGLAALAGGLVAGAGVTAFIIGFAFKDIGENFLSGIILAFNRPFRIGDIIISQDITGTVTSLDLRTTNVKTFDGNDVYIPNSIILKNPLTNYNSDSLRRHEFIVGIEYSSDIGKAVDIIYELLNNDPEIAKEPEPDVLVTELGESSINITVRFWFDADKLDRSWLRAKSDIVKKTKEALDKAGIDIPFPIVQFHLHEPDVPMRLKLSEKENL